MQSQYFGVKTSYRGGAAETLIRTRSLVPSTLETSRRPSPSPLEKLSGFLFSKSVPFATHLHNFKKVLHVWKWLEKKEKHIILAWVGDQQRLNKYWLTAVHYSVFPSQTFALVLTEKEQLMQNLLNMTLFHWIKHCEMTDIFFSFTVFDLFCALCKGLQKKYIYISVLRSVILSCHCCKTSITCNRFTLKQLHSTKNVMFPKVGC